MTPPKDRLLRPWLIEILRDGPMTLSGCWRALGKGWSMGSVTGQLHRMERSGLAHRTYPPGELALWHLGAKGE